jgi:endonuclease/exonuclease/phosphatase family metal-dependent hydrolase
MTQNVFIGAELDSIAAATDPEQIPFLVAQTLDRIVATDFPARAGAIAQEIVNEQPDVVCLQEVTLFQTQSPGDFLAGNPVPASTEFLDYLQLIHDAVAARGARYDVFAAVANWEVELPMITFTETGYQLDDLRATDFDVILVRSDLAPGQLRVVGSNSGNFVAALPLPVAGATVQFLRGWCSVDLDIRGRDVRIVNTHLESVHPYFRTVQAMELVAGVASGTGNLVCAGDFNSDPAFPTPEAYGVMVAARFANAWARLHPADPGYTWGQAPDLLNATSTLNEQDDHIWFRGPGLSATETHLVGNSPTDRVSSIVDATRLLWPSDHAGVVATLRLK